MKPFQKAKLISIERLLITLAIIILMGASFFAGIEICKLYNNLRYFNFEYVDQINNVSSATRQDWEDSKDISDESEESDGSFAIENARISAYTTRPAEGTTCIGYYGENLCYRFYNGEKLIACPSKYGTSTFVIINDIKYRCADRMAPNSWEKNSYDIYMGRDTDAVENANEWGIRYLDITILDN